MKIDIRWAKDADGLRIAELAKSVLAFGGAELDWSRIQPYWLVAELFGRVVAAIQILPAFPIGRLDYLLVDTELGKRERALTVRDITAAGTAILYRAGCQLVGSCIEDGEYLRVAERRGWAKLCASNIVMKRLR